MARNGTDFQKRKKKKGLSDKFSSRGTFNPLTTCQDRPRAWAESQTTFQLGNGMVVKSTLHGPSPALEGCMGWCVCGGGGGTAWQPTCTTSVHHKQNRGHHKPKGD